VGIRLYYMAISHPANAARLMLEHKGLEFETHTVRPGLQPLVTRAHGFKGITVPALDVDGRRIQGSINIARALDELRPEPPLYPSDPDARRTVEEAEEWAERELQPVPRNLLRWAVANNPELLVGFVQNVQGFRPARLVAALERPAIGRFARATGGTEERVRADLAALPGMLDRVDELIDAGVIGGSERNAADFQIGTTMRAMLAVSDLRPLIEGRPGERFGQAIWPDVGAEFPPAVPAEWLPARAALA
jgi:glutathione S-transferase